MTESQPAEEQLLAGLREGTEASAREFVRTYAGPMLSLARRFLDDEDEAMDAVQEAFASAFRAIKEFRGDAALGTWFHRIVVNAALKRVRALDRRPETTLDDLLPVFDSGGERLEFLQGPVIPADQLVEREETGARVRAGIAGLPEPYRAVLLLRDIEGYTTEETADALGITPGAARVRLHRGRAALKRVLEPLLEGGVL